MVVGIAVAGIKGTTINFAIPSEKIQGAMYGRVQNVTLGDAYRDNGAVKLPVTFSFFDPLQSIREVKLDVWSGPREPRPADFKLLCRFPATRGNRSLSTQNRGTSFTN